MRELPITPDPATVDHAETASIDPAFHTLTDEQKVKRLANAFFNIAYDTCEGSAVETTRLGMAAAGHFAGVLFGSLHAEGGARVSAKRKRAQTDMARHFLQGIADARAQAAAALEEAGES